MSSYVTSEAVLPAVTEFLLDLPIPSSLPVQMQRAIALSPVLVFGDSTDSKLLNFFM